MVCLYNHFSGLRIGDGLSNVTAGDTLLQALDGLFAIGECLDLHVRDILAFAAVNLTYDQILGYIYQTTSKVTGVCGTQRGIGHTLSCTMSGNEVLQYVKTLTEVGFDRKLDGVTGCICHKSSHTCQLLDLLIRSSRTGVCHHEDVVVLIQTA